MPNGRCGELGLIVMSNCRELGQKIDQWICQLRGETREDFSFIIPIEEIRFNNGEGKIKIQDSVRSKDLYIITDVGNYHCTYNMFGYENRMGPDEHFQDIKRVVSAIGGKANRITLVMPLLYASRQHKRKGRESLDCAMALEELKNCGIDTILTFDAHDPTIYNAIPGTSFENIFPTYSILKTFIQNEGGDIFKDNMIVISPDTGAMERAIYYANVLGLDVGMFYKRRDHTRIVNGRNPIVQHEYIGGPMEGKKILIIDDMVASGQSLIEVITEARKRNAAEIYAVATFAFFTEGVEKFDALYREGMLTKLYTTNLTYIPDEYLTRPWLVRTDLSKFTARIINTLHNEESISSLLDSTSKIRKLLKHHE